MLKYFIFISIFDFFKQFFKDKKKITLYINVFLFFIDIAKFYKKNFNISIFLNC